MRRREDRALEKHTINLYHGEFGELQTIFGSRIGASKIIRDLVSTLLKKIKGRAEQKMSAVKLVDQLDVSIDIREDNP